MMTRIKVPKELSNLFTHKICLKKQRNRRKKYKPSKSMLQL